MMEKLDTLIAFAVVMLGVSSLITILTQLISTALGLRGSNLLWGLETLFQELAPGLAAAGIRPGDLAKEIIQDQLISDSSFSRVERMKIVGPLVGYLTQVPLAGWLINRWRYATAIRLEELVRMVQRKADALGAGHAATPLLTGLLSATEPAARRRLQMLSAALADVAPPAAGAVANYSVQVDRVLQQAVDTAQQSVGKLETWFNSTMDRASQRFAVQLRLWTVVFAFVVAFAAHLDSLQLLQQLAANPDTRAALVNMREGMLNQAKDILPPTGAAPSTEVPISPAILQQAVEQLKKTDPALAKIGPIPDGISTIQDAVAWLAQQPGVPATTQVEFRKAIVTVLHNHADKINNDLANAGIQILPVPYPGILKFGGPRNLLGVLLAAAFLSLGAPFWYNALRNLSNLRTVVATKEANESAA